MCWAERRGTGEGGRTEVDLLVERVGLEGFGDAYGGLAELRMRKDCGCDVPRMAWLQATQTVSMYSSRELRDR